MLKSPTTPFPQDEILVKHPLTGDMWNVAPLLEVAARHGHNDPGQTAEAIYDTGRYMTAEQNSDCDTAARLRQVLRFTNDLAAAFDSVNIYKASV